MKQSLKIVVLGPESTGKSSLCEALATHFQTLWCREYARQYLEMNGKDYHYEDLLQIAIGQVALEDQAIERATLYEKKFLFIDTDMQVMKVWSEFVYGKCPSFILEQIANRAYDLFLLCDTDIPWESDSLREYPDLKARRELFHIYKDILVQQNIPFAIIHGINEQRVEAAIQVVETYFG